MSHDATNWAIKQRGLKPAQKVVLWHLCDRFHPDNGCFPSQETLAHDCELSRSAINEHLASLENAGLIRREQRRDDRTNRQKSTCYRFAFEADFMPSKGQEPCAESGHGSVSGNSPEPCPENAESRVQNPDTNLVREPVTQPTREREDDQKVVDKWLKRTHPKWPTFISDSSQEALRAALALTSEEREAAADRMDEYLIAAKSGGRVHICSFGVFLKEKRWERLGAKAVVEITDVIAPPFGKMWMAARIKQFVGGPQAKIPGLTLTEKALIESGNDRFDEATFRRDAMARHGWPAVNGMHERARFGNGVRVALTLQPLADLMVQVRVDSDEWHTWRVAHEARGWPWLPDPGKQEWVYFPAGGPDAGMKEFEAAVKRNEEKNNDGGSREAAE